MTPDTKAQRKPSLKKDLIKEQDLVVLMHDRLTTSLKGREKRVRKHPYFLLARPSTKDPLEEVDKTDA